MFIDNPVGTGWSYVEKSSLLTRNNSQIALDLVETMRQFMKQCPQFVNTPLYITSESYGGKMTAEFGLEMDKAIKAGTIKANLKGNHFVFELRSIFINQCILKTVLDLLYHWYKL